MREVEELLTARGAADIAHPGGTQLAHPRRTHDTLTGWGARPALAELIGAEAEAIVYPYGACDRSFTYPLLAGGQRVTVRDRFTGAVSEPQPRQVRDFVELTIANELDVLAHNDDLRAEHGAGLHRLFTACAPYASEPTNAAVTRFFP